MYVDDIFQEYEVNFAPFIGNTLHMHLEEEKINLLNMPAKSQVFIPKEHV